MNDPNTPVTGDPVHAHLTIARDTLTEQLADLTEQERVLRAELHQVSAARTLAETRLAKLLPVFDDIAPQPASPPLNLAEQRAAIASRSTNSTTIASRSPNTTVRATPPASSSSSARSDGARDRWQPVFDWVIARKADGTYSLTALADTFGSWAKNWPAYARKHGVTIPSLTDPDDTATTGTVHSSGAKPGDMHLECTSCDATFPLTAAARLNSHCRTQHGRPANAADRTPVPVS